MTVSCRVGARNKNEEPTRANGEMRSRPGRTRRSDIMKYQAQGSHSIVVDNPSFVHVQAVRPKGHPRASVVLLTSLPTSQLK
mmetsp:Transcript_8380/g.17064  ORF Transcript_8380/g.17064 Transcript_8380/m.17064 type:complete len:82 (-) Transcript_8380:872-1117(-)